MAAPTLLVYNLNEAEMMGLRFLCAGLKIAVRGVPVSDYGQPLAALAGLCPRVAGADAGEDFSGEMLVMANFSQRQFHGLLDALRRNRLCGGALKAVLTPANAEWDSAKLHGELCREREALRGKE